ncbi:M56 family metallopeptidase [Hyphomonas sp. UBA4508]|nr:MULTISPECIES: M56 family metallopeptidase [unclassified Hyphomonas]|tara:strand:+ start:79 stop:1089 length:1011 start_codon:yes stop_codon:yes gene_type:complete
MGNAAFLTNLGIAFFAALLAALIIGAVQSAVWPRFHRHLSQLSPRQYGRAIFGYASVPFVVSLALFVSCAAVPTSAGFNSMPTHCHYEMMVTSCRPHEPMLLTRLAVLGFLAVLALLTMPIVLIFVHRMRLHGRVIRDLETWSRYDPELGAWVVKSRTISAFCVGIVRRRIFVSEGLLASIVPEQARIVLDHERAHARRADALSLFALQVLTLPFFPSARRGLADEFLIAVEYECDRYAASQCGDRLAVAEALITLGRLRQQKRSCEPETASLSVFSVLGQSLERRISWLVQSPLPMRDSGAVLVERLVCYAVIVSFIVAEPVHHGLEQVLMLAFN